MEDWHGGELSVFVPFNVDTNSIYDLGSELKDRELCCAIFNENCKIENSKDKRLSIDIADEKIEVFILDIKNDIDFSSRYEGRILKFRIPSDSNKKNWYVRFRLDMPNLRNQFSQKFTPKGSFYQSVRSSIEAIDFRLNIKRGMNASLLDEKSEKFADIKKCHFFLMCENDEELNFSNIKDNGARLLEAEVWKKYLNNTSKHHKKFCAYHWKQTDTKDGFDIFIKIKYSSSNVRTIIIYIVVISFSTILLNLISSNLHSRFENNKPLFNFFSTEK